MRISLPEGWGQRVDAQKFEHLLEQIWSERKTLGLPEDPGEGPDSFNIPYTDQALFFLEQLYGQSAQIVLRRIATASLTEAPSALPGEGILARMGQALRGILGIILAIAIPIIAVILMVWMLSYFKSKGGPAGGFIAR